MVCGQDDRSVGDNLAPVCFAFHVGNPVSVPVVSGRYPESGSYRTDGVKPQNMGTTSLALKPDPGAATIVKPVCRRCAIECTRFTAARSHSELLSPFGA